MCLKCPICLSESNEKIYKKLSKGVTSDSNFIESAISNVICQDCGNVFNESGSRKKTGDFYSDDYKLMNQSSNAETKFFSSNENVFHSKLRINALMENVELPDIGNILDIGCGKGNFLSEFSKQFPKWKLHGLELNRNALNYARAKLPNIVFYEKSLEDEDVGKKFDLIVSLNVLEHLENQRLFLHQISKNLTDDGLLFLDIPNFKLYPADLFVYDHLVHFTKDTLQNLLNECNLEIVSELEKRNKIPLMVICKKSKSRKGINNHYITMKNLVDDHIRFNDSLFDTYRLANEKYEKIGVYGLGTSIFIGIQNLEISKNKIDSFFDENRFLCGKQKFGIKIRELNEMKDFQKLPLIFSMNPC